MSRLQSVMTGHSFVRAFWNDRTVQFWLMSKYAKLLNKMRMIKPVTQIVGSF